MENLIMEIALATMLVLVLIQEIRIIRIDKILKVQRTVTKQIAEAVVTLGDEVLLLGNEMKKTADVAKAVSDIALEACEKLGKSTPEASDGDETV